LIDTGCALRLISMDSSANIQTTVEQTLIELFGDSAAESLLDAAARTGDDAVRRCGTQACLQGESLVVVELDQQHRESVVRRHGLGLQGSG